MTAQQLQTLKEPFTDKNAASHLRQIVSVTDLPPAIIALGLGMDLSKFKRLQRHKPRPETLNQFERLRRVVEEAFQALTPRGAHAWLSTPNPYLNDVAPIMCLRSEKETEKVLSLLAAIKHGLAA